MLAGALEVEICFTSSQVPETLLEFKNSGQNVTVHSATLTLHLKIIGWGLEVGGVAHSLFVRCGGDDITSKSQLIIFFTNHRIWTPLRFWRPGFGDLVPGCLDAGSIGMD